MKRQPARLLMVLLPTLLGWLSPTSAQDIASITRSLSDIETQVLQLSAAPLQRSRLRSATFVEERLTDGELFYRLQDYVRASIILTDIVESYPNHSAYPDALFLLGDSLFRAGDYLGSRTRFEILLKNADNPRFRPYLQRALGRLIEIAIHTRDFTGVEEYFDRLNRLPSSEVEAATTYFRAKFLYSVAIPQDEASGSGDTPSAIDQDKLEQARSNFERVAQNSPFYGQAQYFIGVIYTIRGEFQPAINAFLKASRLKPTTTDLRAVRDLALLALGRLYYETGMIAKAVEAYQSIPRTSAHFDVALYEVAWAHINEGNATQAERALEVLSVASPDSRYIPDGQILRGNLLLRNGSYVKANGVFQNIATQFEPVKKQLDDIISRQADPALYFRALVRENMEVFDVNTLVPPLALQWTDFEGNMKHAVGILSDLSQARQMVGETQDIIRRMSKALNSPNPINIFSDLRTHRERTIGLRNRLTGIRQKLIAAQERVSKKSDNPELSRIKTRRREIEKEIGQMPQSEADFEKRSAQTDGLYTNLDKSVSQLEVEIMGVEARIVATERYIQDTMKSRKDSEGVAAMLNELTSHRDAIAGYQENVKELRADIEAGRLQVGVDDSRYEREKSLRTEYNQLVARERTLIGSSGSAEGRDIESAFVRAARCEGLLDEHDAKVKQIVNERLSEMRGVLEQERSKLDAYHAQLGDLSNETEVVVGGVTQENFAHVQKRFYDLVMDADVGRIDVSWATREEHRTRVEILTRERTRRIQALDDEFSDITDEKVGRGNK
ncbi:MAG: tetratricopeptide repeat protein [Deltaproteobacteria bacterium]|nr:tetratricopeptide repeat protein [Deltaproteobacteria bacterium]